MSALRTIRLIGMGAALLFSVASTSAAPFPIGSIGNVASEGGAPLILAQGCPRGYDFNYRSGRCYPNRGDRGRSYRSERYSDYDDRPRYGWRGGVACPRGYDSHRGRCVRNYD